MMNAPVKQKAMRKPALIFLIAVSLFLGAFSWFISNDLTSRIENNTRAVVDHAIPIKDMGWVSAKVDGTTVYLSGEAPDQIARVRVTEAMAKKINVSRIVNEIVAPDTNVKAPEVRIEIVQNERVSSIIGLLPRDPSPVGLYRALDRSKPLLNTLNLVEDTSSDAGEAWADQLAFLSAIVGEVPSVKISATPGIVKINAVAASDEAAANVRKTITELAPQTVQLQLNISSPRPMIAPFEFVIMKENDIIELSKCSATDRDDLVAMRAAFRGLEARAMEACKLGLGAPTEDWGQLISDILLQFSDADRFGVHVSDNQVLIKISDQISESVRADQIKKIKALLPAGFGLETKILPTKRTIEDVKSDGQILKLTLEKSNEGLLMVEGLLGSASSLENLKGFAIAKFGSENVTFNIDVVDGLPMYWEKNTFTSIQVIAAMNAGQAVLTKDQLIFNGYAQSKDIRDGLEKMLKAEISDVQIAHEIGIREIISETGLITNPASCVENINDLLANSPIQFEKSSTKIATTSFPNIQKIADALVECKKYRFEIGGHTDSQGGDALNQTISEKRAKSVLDAIYETGMDFGALSSAGFGSSEPIASNETAEGRAQNRRIEIRLITQSGE